MFDTHYDLLTKLYISYKRNNFEYIENWIKNYNYNNVTGLIANLSFMSQKEMNEEYDVNYYHNGDSVIEMFAISTHLLNKYIPKDILVLTSIEGCDYLSDENDLYYLKKLGLNSILPAWNYENKFASGSRSNSGLTNMGRKLIDIASELDIAVDLSHLNEKSFWNIINYVKNNKLNTKLFASHSNVFNLCETSRNLTNDQIIAISDLGGLIGVMSNSRFVDIGSMQKIKFLKGTSFYEKYIEYLKEKYIEHILYIEKLTNNINSICLSTDDMGFCELDKYNDRKIFEYGNIAYEINNLLMNYYNEEDINKIMHENIENFFNKKMILK